MTLLLVFLLGCALGVVGWFIWLAFEFMVFMQVWDEQLPQWCRCG